MLEVTGLVSPRVSVYTGVGGLEGGGSSEIKYLALMPATGVWFMTWTIRILSNEKIDWSVKWNEIC